ncbi:thiamine-phosphate kinase [Mycolicibacterium moriokaense]|jgi:thiamine-monophosphate kinase|uniref:Thiamine-monophosphate kinase n=1 Tax=Mycolicibacterium moriokaense TaxID=39691 RepID=A0AAD1HE84_9MYCO|nr:thiamine-phosphate kinase [Mycolicibacterium moriokaense]MCV7040453.1 thiamine-phosphate kinase [Mycolicibacterium moriokaense]ORB15125.1 thiamine-phosphate kinase [Mycolicibacterium moriokaense]BBX03404.1 thiamine-monophosphate kinase [Mycolicibacterium moriokaense]
MTSEQPPETLAGVGEFAVIDRLVAGRQQPDVVALGPGDDAAVVRVSDGATVVSTDMLVEGSHFRLDWSTPHDVGRKAIAQNAADIEAMGATATAFVVAFGAGGDTPAAQVVELADGLWYEARLLGAGIVGGDLVTAPQWVISVTALGDLGGREAVRLDGARPGDRVAIIGDVGWSAAGYALLRNDIDGFDTLRRRHLVPKPPYGQGRVASEAGATSMTDVSDGLVADLGHIARASEVGIDLSTDSLRADHDPLTEAAAAAATDPWGWVLGGGEDHSLVATFPGAVPAGWRAIGRVLDGPSRVLVDGEQWRGHAGWQSF